MSRDLPKSPNLDHLRKQAKARLRELQLHKPNAKLSEAQRVVAREYGFASWAKLKAHVESELKDAELAPADDISGSQGGGGSTTTGTSGSNDPGSGLFHRFTLRARRVIFFARYWAVKRASERIETEHLLLGLVEEDGDLIKHVLGNASAAETFRAAILRPAILRRSPGREEFARAQPIPISSAGKRIIQLAAEEADRLGHALIATGHFWLAFLEGNDPPAMSVLAEVFRHAGLSMEKVRGRIIDMLGENS